MQIYSSGRGPSLLLGLEEYAMHTSTIRIPAGDASKTMNCWVVWTTRTLRGGHLIHSESRKVLSSSSSVRLLSPEGATAKSLGLLGIAREHRPHHSSSTTTFTYLLTMMMMIVVTMSVKMGMGGGGMDLEEC
ncbi:hypothetical protein GPALN_005865 [Globodera pallida]|nr:hypothetical protein GPALN_005865 [Globodera pallida]